MGASEIQVKWGGNNDPRGVLKKDTVYQVESIEVHTWHTEIKLVGIEGQFNSVSFIDVEETQQAKGDEG